MKVSKLRTTGLLLGYVRQRAIAWWTTNPAEADISRDRVNGRICIT